MSSPENPGRFKDEADEQDKNDSRSTSSNYAK